MVFGGEYPCSALFFVFPVAVRFQVSMQRINHRLRRFVGMSKLKKVALNVIAQQLTEAEIGHLRGVRVGSWLLSRDTFWCSRRTLSKTKNRNNVGLMATSKYVLPHPLAGFVTKAYSDG